MTSTLNLGSKIPMSEVDGLTTAMSNKADINFLNVGGGGVKTCFRWLKPDLTRGVSIANNGSMPFDEWAFLQAGTWNDLSPNGSGQKAEAYINDVLIIRCMSSYINGGNMSNDCVAQVPVKQGDIFKSVLGGNNGNYSRCRLYPYEAAPEEETEV